MQANEPIRLIMSERNKEQAVVGGHKYRLVGRRHEDGLLKWRCSNDKYCYAFIYTGPDKSAVLDRTGKHRGHVPAAAQPGRVQMQVLRENCKRRASEMRTTEPADIIRTELAKLRRADPETSIGFRASVISVRKAMLERWRRERPVARPPTSLNESLALLNAAQTDQRFMFDGKRYVHVSEGKRFVCLTTAENIRFLCEYFTELFVDSSFEYSPKYFTQVYILYGVKNGIYIPLVHFLLDGHTVNTFSEMWAYLKRLCTETSPDHVFDFRVLHVDKESAMHRTAIAHFPNVKIQGRVFSFDKAWRKQIRSTRPLNRAFANPNDELGVWLKQFFALPYLPCDEIGDAFVDLISVCPNLNVGYLFSDYIVDNYIENDCTYPPNTWAEKPSSNPTKANGPGIFKCNQSSPSIYSLLDALLIKQLEAESMKGSIINSNNSGMTNGVNTEENRRIRDTLVAYNKYSSNKTQDNLLSYLSNVANWYL